MSSLTAYMMRITPTLARRDKMKVSNTPNPSHCVDCGLKFEEYPEDWSDDMRQMFNECKTCTKCTLKQYNAKEGSSNE